MCKDCVEVRTITAAIRNVRSAQKAVIPGRLRQGALKPFAARYPGKVLYPKSSVSRAGRRAFAASIRSGFEVMKRRLLEAGQRLGVVMRSVTAGMVQTSPGAHGKLSQDAVAEGRRIAFAVARAMMRLARTSLSSCFLSSVRPSLLQTSSRAIEIALMSSGPLPPIRKTARCSLHSLPTQEVLAPRHSLNGALAAAGDVPVPYSIVGPEVGPNPYKPGVQCSRPDLRSVSPKRPPELVGEARRLGVTGHDPCSHDPRSIKRAGRIELRSYGLAWAGESLPR
jgi:hypothetical protein